nr:response regulator [Herbaspirillum sp. ASV7]
MTSSSAPQVLLVDDSATIRQAIGNRLQAMGCLVHRVVDGAAALAAIRAQTYGLVLLDCYLPDMLGHEVAQQVRMMESAEPQRPYTPLIGISAESDPAHVRLCLEKGMDGMLGKPLQSEALRKMLALWCDHEWPDAGTQTSSCERAGEDLQQLFLRTSQYDLQALRAAHTGSDLAVMAQLVHRMKGAALTMQRAEIVALLECVEEALRTGADGLDSIPLLLVSLGRILEV